jgi:predicted phage tail protein
VATIDLTVTPVNDAPTANGQSASTAYNTSTAITLTGTDVENSALSFTVLSNPSGGSLTGTAPNLTFVPTIGFAGNTSFTFRVNDGSLNSAAATVSITVNAPSGVPSAPTSLSATAISKTQINLAWTDNSNNEDGFKIERMSNGSPWTQIGMVGPNVTTFSSTGLSANKVYDYRVRAYNLLGNSPYSNTASAKTLK